MRIRKLRKNEYIYASGMWVRNFASSGVADNINHITSQDDRAMLSYNEQMNSQLRLANISDETVTFDKVVIVSDGYDFEEKHKILPDFPKDVSVIAVNGALNKWKLKGNRFRPINVYLINNPYPECMRFAQPRGSKYYPTCVASSRTHPEFLKRYQGNRYLYDPSPEASFGFEKDRTYFIDDYRNPVCAAICLAYHFGARKLMLLCCDDAFDDQRPSAMQLENGLWTYPQHFMAQKLIDANLFWFKKVNGNEIANYSKGADYVNSHYISSDEEAIRFFKDEEELNEETVST